MHHTCAAVSRASSGTYFQVNIYLVLLEKHFLQLCQNQLLQYQPFRESQFLFLQKLIHGNKHVPPGQAVGFF